jgi:hypothetical protein
VENRELGLNEMYERIKLAKTSLGLVSFFRTPTRPSELGDLPCLFMIEGPDRIIKKSSRDNLGYPATRVLEVSFDYVLNKRGPLNIKSLYVDLRRAIFKVRNSDPVEYSSIIASNVFISENRTEGPTGYGLPDIEAMRLVIDLTYIDGGL